MIEALMMSLADMIEAKTLNVVAIIPARGGSKRLKRKNIYPIWDKPMIHWPIEAARNSKHINEIWVTTEDKEIAQVAAKLGVNVHDRPKEFSEDHVYKMEAIRSCHDHIQDKRSRKIDIVVSLQANSPEITSKHLDEALDFFIEHDRNEVMSVGTNLVQNAAFRIMKSWYVSQRDLSTKSGVYVCDVHDVHTLEDVEYIQNRTPEQQ
jgi:CMP-N-acetylneuraminic acid synthetase